MKIVRARRALNLILILSILLPACSTLVGGYWVPPPPTITPPPALAFLSQTPLPSQQAPDPTEAVSPSIPLPTPTNLIAVQASGLLTPTLPTATPVVVEVNNAPILYRVQAADTLPVVAIRFEVQPHEIQSADGQPLPETEFLTPDQLLIIPRRLANTTSSEHLLPDSEVVYSPSATDFDIEAFVQQAGGKLSRYQEWLKSTGLTSGAKVVQRVADENSINPRLLLSLLEYQSQWVYGEPDSQAEDHYPMGYIDANHRGLFQQLVWAVNQLSIGYYAYREGRMTSIRFQDGMIARMAPDLNAGSASLQYFFAQLYQGQEWLDALNPATGLPALHENIHGSPWERARRVEPLFPPGITQPPLILPFRRNWVWSYTGGPHGAWEHDGAYAALDFAPGSTSPGCNKSTAWVTAAGSGLVTRSGNGVVVLDLDGDGREMTGWVLLYLHVSSVQRVPVGTWVDVGDPLGHPSCEGGYSTGTHLHFARKYNGEWIPADGPLPFNLGGWVAHAGDGPYLGTLTRGDETVTACVCGSAATSIIRTESDP